MRLKQGAEQLEAFWLRRCSWRLIPLLFLTPHKGGELLKERPDSNYSSSQNRIRTQTDSRSSWLIVCDVKSVLLSHTHTRSS